MRDGIGQQEDIPRKRGLFVYLNKGGRWRGPAFVQNTPGQVFTQIFEEGAAYMVQEILVLRAVFLMTIDEAFYEPETKKIKVVN